MRYQLIEKQKKVWPINLLCGVLEVSRSGYCDWASRDLSQHGWSNQELDRRIQVIFAEHQQRYGAPRIARPYIKKAEGAVRIALPEEWVPCTCV